jgi:DNA-binding winged helix-turn-helix (wHTH) protein
MAWTNDMGARRAEETLLRMTQQSGWLQVGACDIDVTRRVVTSREDGRTSRLTVKAQQILLALVEARGMVVSRDTLLSRVWPNTMPTDDVLTQAVTQLRKAFGDDRAAPRYIETIAKGGYRLLADFEWKESGAEPCQDGSGHLSDATVEFGWTSRSQRNTPAVADTPFDAALLLLLLAVVRRDCTERPPQKDATSGEMLPVACSVLLSPLA